MANNSKKITAGFLANMTAWQRVLMSLCAALVTFFIIRGTHPRFELAATSLWIAFAFTYILASWIIFFKMPAEEIKKKANKEDGSRFFVLVFILICCFVSLCMVLLLMLSSSEPGSGKASTIAVAIVGMILSWGMVHTIFTFHYAHLYYFDDIDDSDDEQALEFPGGQPADYLDFAYFSFVIGMTFQVSDVEINSRVMRRTVLLHGLLSFAINTFVVALTINFIAGFK